MPAFKLILITGTDLRHRYVQNRIHQESPLDHVFYEEHVYPATEIRSEEEESAWKWFFETRDQHEAGVFSHANSPDAGPPPPSERLAAGTLNSQSTLDLLNEIQPDLILLFDTSLITDPILKQYSGKIWNLHVGLSDHYRGSSCNFWPIYDQRLDCLGATVLTIDPGIDTGGILAQKTIHLDIQDTVQSCIGKTIQTGADLIVETLRQWKRGTLTSRPLSQRGKLYLKKDFQPGVVLKVKKWVESGEWQKGIKRHLME